MSMAVASGAVKSTLNPNAPLFIPAAFQQVEDFSPEWWELVKTTSWFGDYWFHEHQAQETFDGEDEDIINLLPDSFDLGIADEFSEFQPQSDEFDGLQLAGMSELTPTKKGLESDAEKMIKNLNLKSPKNGVRPMLDAAKYKEKPTQTMYPRNSPRRVIHQPR